MWRLRLIFPIPYLKEEVQNVFTRIPNTKQDLRSNDEKRLLENQLLHLRAAISEIESEKVHQRRPPRVHPFLPPPLFHVTHTHTQGGHQNRRHLDAELASLRSKLREMEGAQIVAVRTHPPPSPAPRYQPTKPSTTHPTIQEATSDDDRRSLAAQLASLQHEVAAAGQREAARADGLLRYAQEGDSHVLQELQRVRGAVSERRARMEDELRSVRERLQAKERTMTADTHRLEAELQAMKRGMLDLNEAQSAALLRDRDALEGDLVSVKAHLARMVDEQAVERARAEAAARDVLGQAEAIAHGGRARAAAETEQKLATLEVELHRHHNAEAEQLQATYTTMLDGVEGQVKALHEALLQSQEVCFFFWCGGGGGGGWFLSFFPPPFLSLFVFTHAPKHRESMPRLCKWQKCSVASKRPLRS